MTSSSEPTTPTCDDYQPQTSLHSHLDFKPVSLSRPPFPVEIITLRRPISDSDTLNAPKSFWDSENQGLSPQQPSNEFDERAKQEELTTLSYGLDEPHMHDKVEDTIQNGKKDKEDEKARLLGKYWDGRWTQFWNAPRSSKSSSCHPAAASHLTTSQRPSGISKPSTHPRSQQKITQRRRSAREGNSGKGGNHAEDTSCLAETLLTEEKEDAMVIDSQDLHVRTGVGSEQAVNDLGRGVDKMTFSHESS